MLQPQCLGREKRVALAHELCGVPNEEQKNLLSPFSSQTAFANYNLMSGPVYYLMVRFYYLITRTLLYLTKTWAEGCLLLIYKLKRVAKCN